MRDLKLIREDIDAIDRQIVSLFEERMNLTTQVAEYKISTGKPVFDAEREAAKLDAVAALAHSEFNAEGARELFEHIMTISRKQQYQLLRNHGQTVTRDPKDRKILYIDLDGTTLNDDKTISEENYNALQELLKQGHCVAVTTGRALASAKLLSERLHLNGPGCYLLCYNGGMAYDWEKDQILKDARIPREDALYLYEQAKEAGIFIQTYDDTQVLAAEDTYEIKEYCRLTNMQYTIDPFLWEHLNHDLSKIVLCDMKCHENLVTFRKEHKNWSDGRYYSIFSCDELLEYCPLDATKGHGVHFLADYLGVPMENTVAVGDEENDLSMIVEAHVGCGMCNGIPEVLEAADYVTERDNNHAGLAEVIRKFIL